MILSIVSRSDTQAGDSSIDANELGLGFSRLRAAVKRKRYADAAIKVAALRKAAKVRCSLVWLWS